MPESKLAEAFKALDRQMDYPSTFETPSRSTRGGAHPSIARSSRNEQMYQDWLAGTRKCELSAKHQISPQRVHIIVQREVARRA